MPNDDKGRGLLDYIGMQYEKEAPMSDAGGLSAGQEDPGVSVGKESFGDSLKKFIPGAALSALAGSIGGDDTNWGEGLQEFTQGYLGSKLDNAMKTRERKLGQEDFFIKEAYKAVEELHGADLSGIQVPQHIKQSLSELHRKANEALMNDGVISAKEAATLLALAHPIKAALAEAKTEQGRPEFQAREKERGVVARFLEEATQERGKPLGETDEGDVLQGTTPEQDENRGRKRYSEAVQAGSAKVWPGLEQYGPLSAKDAVKLRERILINKSATERALISAETRNKDRIMSDRHFQARVGMFDQRQQQAAALAIMRNATAQAVQELTQGVGGRDARNHEAVDARVDELIEDKLNELALSGAPARGSRGTTESGASFTLEP